MSDETTDGTQESKRNITNNSNDSSKELERNFINTHQKGWKHGVTKPYSVVKYNKVDRSRYGIMQEREEAELNPAIVLEEVGPSQRGAQHETRRPVVEPCNKRNHSVFAPYFSIPSVLFSVPKAPKNLSYSTEVTIPQLCYQNYFDLDGYSFVFGGLVADTDTLSNYGIPLNTDPSRISVYLSSDVPTHVNKDVLMSPYIVQNKHFFKYNSIRKVIIYLDTIDSQDYPGNINELMITRISDSFLFFYGGFYIKDESSEYREDINRWIIKRKLVLNEDGYIFNLDTLRFTKINLTSNTDDLKIPRIGGGIVSNKYKQVKKQDVMTRVPLPPIFADVDELEEIKSPKAKGLLSINTNMKSLYETSSNSIKYNVSLHSSSDSAKSGISNASIASAPGSQKTGILGKLTKLFHRHNTKGNSLPLKSPQLQGLQHTYSDLVSKNRSNSFNSIASRPSSPFQSPQTNNLPPVKAIRDEIKNIDNSESEDNNSFITSDDSSIKNTEGDEEQGSRDATEDHSQNNPLFKNINSDPTKYSVLVFIFGGFIPEDLDGYQVFKATDELLRIELVLYDSLDDLIFEKDAEVVKCNSILTDESKLWPSPRGYFAYTLVDCRRGLDTGEACLTSFTLSSDPSSDDHSAYSSSTRGSDRRDKYHILERFFSTKTFIVQGGTNEKYETFSDFYIFDFLTCTWQLYNTYAFNYFDSKLQPYEDDDISLYSDERKVKNPELEEAELRASHHSAIFYRADDWDYLFFFGGYRNDYLRLFDKEPYKSDKLDVSRLSKFSLTPSNQQLLRFSVLNLQTQTWRFLRFYYDMGHTIEEECMRKIQQNESWSNARLCNIGSTYSISENVVTIGHGLIVPVAEKKEDMDKLRNEIPTEILLAGARVCFTIPNV